MSNYKGKDIIEAMRVWYRVEGAFITGEMFKELTSISNDATSILEGDLAVRQGVSDLNSDALFEEVSEKFNLLKAKAKNHKETLTEEDCRKLLIDKIKSNLGNANHILSLNGSRKSSPVTSEMAADIELRLLNLSIKIAGWGNIETLSLGKLNEISTEAYDILVAVVDITKL